MKNSVLLSRLIQFFIDFIARIFLELVVYGNKKKSYEHQWDNSPFKSWCTLVFKKNDYSLKNGFQHGVQAFIEYQAIKGPLIISVINDLTGKPTVYSLKIRDYALINFRNRKLLFISYQLSNVQK